MAKVKSDASASKPDRKSKLDGAVFGKKNYLLLAVGVSVMGIGYLLMTGGRTSDPAIFQPDELYSFVRITLAPAVILVGIVICGIAIFIKDKRA